MARILERSDWPSVTEYDVWGATITIGASQIELSRSETISLLSELNSREDELNRVDDEDERPLTDWEQDLLDLDHHYGDPIGTAQAFADETEADDFAFPEGDAGALIEALLGGNVRVVTLPL